MTDQPNIVFILIDDLGWRDLSCYGSTFYETPNLDRMAREGMLFTDAYASAPVCSPTRASLMSGKYPARVGVTQYIGGHSVGRLCDVPYFQALPMSEISVAASLRRGGYQTWHVGKWHLGDRNTWPDRHGFDINIGGCGWGHPHHGYFSPYQCPALAEGPEGEYLTDRLTDEAIALIEQRDPDRPFFLNLWHYAVHNPIQGKAEVVRKYEQKAFDLGLDPEGPMVPGEYLTCQHKQHERIQRRLVQSHPGYAAMVETLDENVGRLLDALDAAGVAENTIVVFTSDNGGLATSEGSPTSNRPLSEGKGWMYEGGTRICQIVRWPARITAESVCTVPTTSPDWYPTLLEAAALPALPEQHPDGVSIMPLFTRGDAGEDDLDREAIFWHYPHYSNQGGTPACSVRSGDWKLIEFFEDGRRELYNLRDDISEEYDLAAEEPERVQSLGALLARWREETEARIPGPNPNFIYPGVDEIDPGFV